MSESSVVGSQRAINLNATRVEEIEQNIWTLMTTRQGSVPYARDRGLSEEFIDAPLPIARAKTRAEIVEMLERYEPRIRVTRVEFEESSDDAAEGRTLPRIHWELREGVAL